VLEVPLIIGPDPETAGCAVVWVEGAAAGRRRRFILDTGAARTQLVADDATLHLGERGHCYLTVTWPASSGPAVTAHACWDSGASITVAGQAFAGRHPELFARAGQAEGTDSSGVQASTPLAELAGPVIGGVRFAPHLVAVADLSAVNATLSDPMDLILGYPTLAQASTSRPGGGP
jgi:hypothetical protein